jgi:hypothetical protein
LLILIFFFCLLLIFILPIKKGFQILKLEAKWDVIVAMLLDWLYNLVIICSPTWSIIYICIWDRVKTFMFKGTWAKSCCPKSLYTIHHILLSFQTFLEAWPSIVLKHSLVKNPYFRWLKVLFGTILETLKQLNCIFLTIKYII